jgi:hypothetical protein
LHSCSFFIFEYPLIPLSFASFLIWSTVGILYKEKFKMTVHTQKFFNKETSRNVGEFSD